jgi:drug/metabolite transporter (DMT)-like permease
MKISIIFALTSLLFAGHNDLVFKKQASGGHCRETYLMVIGGVWMAGFAVLALGAGLFPVAPAGLGWGMVAGIYSALANYFLIASLRHLDASVGAAIYRLNLIVVTLMAVVFLEERLSTAKVAGLVLASLSVILFSEWSGTKAGTSAGFFFFSRTFMLAVLACLLRAGMGLSYKLAAGDFAKLSERGWPDQNFWFLSVQGGEGVMGLEYNTFP